MPDSNKMSRRDWFRLSPRTDKSDSEASVPDASVPDAKMPVTSVAEATASRKSIPTMGQSKNGLQPIAQPENHDGMNLSELPPMREALLSEQQVRELFNDISTQATDVLLMQRSAKSRRASSALSATTEQMMTACESVVSRTVPRIQIRYSWQAANWIDTLECKEDGFRLVRITHVVPRR